MVGGFDVLLVIAGGVVDCEYELTAVERGARERCVGARAMAGGNIRATAVPGLGSSAMESWERAQQEFKGGRGCACGVHAIHSLCVKKKEEATASVLSLVYVRASLARCE